MPTGLTADEVNFGAAVAVRVASAELDVVGPVPGDEAVVFRRVHGELARRAGGCDPPDLYGMALLLAVEYGDKTAAAAIQVRAVNNLGARPGPRIDQHKSAAFPIGDLDQVGASSSDETVKGVDRGAGLGMLAIAGRVGEQNLLAIQDLQMQIIAGAQHPVLKESDPRRLF